MEDPTAAPSKFLFLVASSRNEGAAETLAGRAAAALDGRHQQRWLRLADLPLDPFVDIRHDGDGTYPVPHGHAQTLLEATLEATDLVFVVPVYWYSLPTLAKHYLDHWSAWMRVAGVDFKARMAGKRLWAITIVSDETPASAEPLLGSPPPDRGLYGHGVGRRVDRQRQPTCRHPRRYRSASARRHLPALELIAPNTAGDADATP